jgi:hypothetical protein
MIFLAVTMSFSILFVGYCFNILILLDLKVDLVTINVFSLIVILLNSYSAFKNSY